MIVCKRCGREHDLELLEDIGSYNNEKTKKRH